MQKIQSLLQPKILTDNVVFYQILRLKDVELWQTKDGAVTFKAKGYLQALYAKEMDIFLLKFNDLKIHLTKSLQIISSFNDVDGYFSYDIPFFDGYHTFKVPKFHSGPTITNFDTFLRNTSSLIRRPGLHQDMTRPHEGIISEGLHKTWDTISEVFVHHHPDDGPNNKVVRSFRDMLKIEGPNYPLVDIPSLEVVTIMEESGEITRTHQDSMLWTGLRGEFQPSLIQEDDNLFIEDKQERLERWGSNITDRSTSTQRSGVSFDVPESRLPRNMAEEVRSPHLPNSALAFLEEQQNLSNNYLGSNLRTDLA